MHCTKWRAVLWTEYKGRRTLAFSELLTWMWGPGYYFQCCISSSVFYCKSLVLERHILFCKCTNIISIWKCKRLFFLLYLKETEVASHLPVKCRFWCLFLPGICTWLKVSVVFTHVQKLWEFYCKTISHALRIIDAWFWVPSREGNSVFTVSDMDFCASPSLRYCYKWL